MKLPASHPRFVSQFRSLSLVAAVLAVTHTASAARPCPPDTNCSGAVDVADLLTVISSWGNAGGAADVNNSGHVDVGDLLAVITTWGPCAFDYGPVYRDAEAHQIGLEMVDTLTLPQATYDRIDRDLNLIRLAYPALAGQAHSEAWIPNQLIVGVQQGQDLTDYQCANTYYRKSSQNLLFSFGGTDYYEVTFNGKCNTEALGAIYANLPGVSSADPNGLFGGENRWTPTDMGGGVWKWNIDDGFWDCFDGCDCHRVYEIDIDLAGNVTLVNYDQWGQEWCTW